VLFIENKTMSTAEHFSSDIPDSAERLMKDVIVDATEPIFKRLVRIERQISDWGIYSEAIYEELIESQLKMEKQLAIQNKIIKQLLKLLAPNLIEPEDLNLECESLLIRGEERN
jgi:hypothetical protein